MVNGVDLGPCPICGRPMLRGRSVDRHHWVPRSKGGREQTYVHKICHRKLHSVWREAELAKIYNNPETIRDDPLMLDFIAWVRKKPADFYSPTRTAHRRR